MAQRPTMHDVAAKAGVSQAVVSLVLGGRYAGRASERTAERIREAADALGYRRNLQAKTLKTGVAEIIGLVGDEVATSPFSGQMIKGAQDLAWGGQHPRRSTPAAMPPSRPPRSRPCSPTRCAGSSTR